MPADWLGLASPRLLPSLWPSCADKHCLMQLGTLHMIDINPLSYKLLSGTLLQILSRSNIASLTLWPRCTDQCAEMSNLSTSNCWA